MSVSNTPVTYNPYSSEVSAFPTAKRISTEFYQSSRLLSELNLISFVNRLTDGNSFLLTSSLDGDLSMNIGGYLFTIAKGSDKSAFTKIKEALVTYDPNSKISPKIGDYIVAYIQLENDMLYGIDTQVDTTYVYNGITFQYVQTAPTDPHREKPDESLPQVIVAKCVTSKATGQEDVWEVPQESLVKFKTASMHINGGVDELPQE